MPSNGLCTGPTDPEHPIVDIALDPFDSPFKIAAPAIREWTAQ